MTDQNMVEQTATQSDQTNGHVPTRPFNPNLYKNRLRSDDWQSRQLAAEELGQFGTVAKPILNLLLYVAFTDGDQDVIEAAKTAVTKIDKNVDLDLLDNRDRLGTIQTWLEGEINRLQIYLSILGFVTETDDYNRESLLETLTTIANEHGDPFDNHIRFCLDTAYKTSLSGDTHKCMAIAAAVLPKQSEELTDLLLKTAETEESFWEVRQEAVIALGNSTLSEDTLERITIISIRDTDSDVRDSATDIIDGQSLESADSVKNYITIARDLLDNKESLDDAELWTNIVDRLLQEKEKLGLKASVPLLDHDWGIDDSILDKLLDTALANEECKGLFKVGLILNPTYFIKKTIERPLPSEKQTIFGKSVLKWYQKNLTNAWKNKDTDKTKLINIVKATKRELSGDYWEARRNAVIWLGSNETLIQEWNEDEHEAIYNDLLKSKDEEDDADVRMTIEMVVLLFERTIENFNESKLITQLSEKGDNIDITIKHLLDKENRKSVRNLLPFWVEWVVLDEKYSGVVSGEERLRLTSMAVLPLVERLKHPLQLSDLKLEQDGRKVQKDNLITRITRGQSQEATDSQENLDDSEEKERVNKLETLLKLFVPSDLLSLVERLFYSDNLTGEERRELQKWFIAHLGNHGSLTIDERKQLHALPESEGRSSLDKSQLRKFLILAIQNTLKKRENELHRRITALLHKMSHPWHLQSSKNKADNRELIEEIKEELRRHAVSYFASQLRTESDSEIRENMARTLANLADPDEGQTAIDALVTAVIGEERRQNKRQALLSEYYLEPSKQRSEEAADILRDAVDQAKITLNSLRRLNQHLFYVGLAVFVLGFTVAAFSQNLSSQVIGVLSGMGGLLGVIRHMVKDPLDRIQNAMGNLVQMEAAFTSFMWELNLNQTFIQSRYVANGHLTQDEIQSTVDRVENVMKTTMSLVETYTETTSPRIVTRLYKVAPVSVILQEKEQIVTVHGQYLMGDSTNKKEMQGMIALNHNPIDVKVTKWNENEVRFPLSETIIQRLTGEDIPDSMLVSLFIDGMETNAIPLRLQKSA